MVFVISIHGHILWLKLCGLTEFAEKTKAVLREDNLNLLAV